MLSCTQLMTYVEDPFNLLQLPAVSSSDTLPTPMNPCRWKSQHVLSPRPTYSSYSKWLLCISWPRYTEERLVKHIEEELVKHIEELVKHIEEGLVKVHLHADYQPLYADLNGYRAEDN